MAERDPKSDWFVNITVRGRNVTARGQFLTLLLGGLLLVVLVRLAMGNSVLPKELVDLIVAAAKLRLGIP